MNKLLKTYNFSNFEIVKGNGCYLYTSKKKKLLDFSAGVAVNSLGITTQSLKKVFKIKSKQAYLIYQVPKFMSLKLNFLNFSLKKVIKAISFSPIQAQKALKQHLKLQEIMEINLKKMKS